MKNVRFVVILTLVASSAWAQQLLPFTRSVQTYQPLIGATPLTITEADEGFAVINLPFVFPFAGASFQTVYAHVNGLLMLTLPAACSASSPRCDTFGFRIVPIPSPSAVTPNHIAALWQDLSLSSGGQVRLQSSSQRVVIEWAGVTQFNTSNTANFQIALEPNGNFSIHHGPMVGTGLSAVVGYQAGTSGYAVLGSNCTPMTQNQCCASTAGTSRCSGAEIVPNSFVQSELPALPDLIAQSVLVTDVQPQPTGELSMTITARVANFSRAAASNWTWRAVLSPDAVRDPPDGGPGLPDGGTAANDIPLLPESTGNNLAASASADFVASVTSAAAAPGDYFVILELDPEQALAEFSETNNRVVLPYQITAGTDLNAASITGVPLSGPDAVDTVRVQYFNRGRVGAGSVGYRIMLAAARDAGLVLFPDGGSLDLLPDGGEGPGPVGVRVINRGSRNITGGETIDETVQVLMPNDAPQGEFFYVLQLDPTGVVTETNRRNNVVFSNARVDIRRSDLLLETIELVDNVTRVPVRTVLFGETYRALVRFRNQGGGTARNFVVGVILSSDSNLSLLGDDVVGSQLVTELPSTEGSRLIEIPFTLPVVDRTDAGLPTGNYYVFVALDVRVSVFESNKGNNTGNIGPIRGLSAAPDFTVSSIQAPATAGIGEVIPVFRTTRNIGNRGGQGVEYRYYASANTIISPTDVLLPILQLDGGVTPTGTVSIPPGGSESRTDLVKLPTSMPPGSYFVGCLVDPDNAVPELIESNNALASNAVQVVQSALRIPGVQLPDATVGRPYFFRLSATGESGPSTWVLEPGQGEPPVGLTLTPTGDLTGTPTGAGGTGVKAFTVTVTNQGRVAQARLVMRLLPSTAQVAITTEAIPALVNSPSATFQYPLGAAGGSRPYAWRIVSGQLPTGLTFNADGVLGGAPRAGTPDGIARVTFEVRDASGGSARKELPIRLVAAGSIVIRTTRLPDAVVNQDYSPIEFVVANADNSPVAQPLNFQVSGNLPPGLITAKEMGLSVYTVSGRPTRAGTYTFTLTVEDARGRTDSLDYTITVYTNRFRIVANNLPQVVRPQDPVSATFAAQPSVPDTTFSIVSGGLPPGITLSSAGALEGTVEDLDAAVGTFTFVVEAKDTTGVSGLAPFALVVERPPRRMGCSSVDAGPLGAFLLALLALLRRGRSRLAPALAAAAVAVPAVGLAQGYIASTPAPFPFQALPNRTILAPSTSGGARVALPFAFRFYDQPYTEVLMSRFGYLALAGSDSTVSSNPSVPSPSAFGPQTVIAPWWDNLVVPSGTTNNYGWTVTGSAPNRVAIFEWRDLSDTAATGRPRITFQVQLFETSNQIRFSYGATAPGAASASVGIQGARSVGLAGLPCGSGANCQSGDWPANQAIDVFLPADLRISRLAVDQTGYAGVRYGATAFVRNEGGRQASNVTVRFYLSADAVLDVVGDTLIGDGMATNVPVGEETPVALPTSLPMNVMAGPYFLIAVVDPSNAVQESNENNNIASPVSMVIGSPRADLAASNVTAPATATPGSMVMVTRTLSNQGNAPAAAFKYTYLLSDNNVISISDRALTPVGDSTGLAPGMMDTAGAMLALPMDLAGGTYWLGVCVNFDGANATSPFPLDEISVVNNCAVAPMGTVIASGALTVTTSTLPMATQYSPYGLRLQASGGAGSVTWAVTAGALPVGMGLSADGTLSGAPARTGSFSFEVTATSGTLTATRMLSLGVSMGNLPLVIVDQELPGAEFGRAYEASLVAVGGKPPYRWALRPSASLPDGLALAQDGRVEGRATESGEKTFEVEVTDSADTKVARELRIRVVNPTSLSIGTIALTRGVLRQSYLQRLVVVGGRAPYQWSVTRFQQLPQNPTESPGEVQMGLPEGFGLTIQDGINEDFLTGTPRRAGLFALTLLVKDGAGTEDSVSVTMQVSYSEALAITTTVLPDAFVNQSYAVKLSHNGGREAMVTFSTACIRQAKTADQFECVPVDANQALPAGLSLGPDGSIIGVPSPATPVGTYTFLVKVADDGGRQDIRGLSIRLQPDYAAASSGGGGCSTGLGLGSLGWLAVLGALRRRRALRTLSNPVGR